MMIEPPKCLNLRADIICPECLGKYRLNNTYNYSGKIAITHPLGNCRRSLEGLLKHEWFDTQYIEAKPLGEGIAVVQVPTGNICCDECQSIFLAYTLEALRIIYFHPASSYPTNKCQEKRAIPLGQLTIFI